MMNTDEIQGTPGSVFLARQPHSKKRSKWYNNLRQFTRSQRQGGHGRHGPGGETAGHIHYRQRRSARTVLGRHLPRGCQGAGTREGLFGVAIHGLRCILPEARLQGTRRLPQNCQKPRRKTRYARGRNWARRGRDKLLILGARFQLCLRRVW